MSRDAFGVIVLMIMCFVTVRLIGARMGLYLTENYPNLRGEIIDVIVPFSCLGISLFIAFLAKIAYDWFLRHIK